MSIPSDATKTNCDSTADDPKLALTVDLAGVIDKLNTLLADLRTRNLDALATVAVTDTDNTFTADQTIQSAAADAATGPIVTLDRNSASPAASDVLGEVRYQGRDSGGGTDVYASIHAKISDPTATSEDGKVEIDTKVGGSLSTRVTIAEGVQVGSASGGDKGAGTVNATALYDDGAQVIGPKAVVSLTALTSATCTVTTLLSNIGTVTCTRSAAGTYSVSWSTAVTAPYVTIAARRAATRVFVDFTSTSTTSVGLFASADGTTGADPDEIHLTIWG